MKKPIYKNLEKVMIDADHTRTSLAEEIGMTYRTFSRIMRNETALTLDVAIDIKKALGTDMSIEELFQREE